MATSRSVPDALDRAAEGCADEDMRSKELEDALSFAEAHVEKGATLADAFGKALGPAEPWRRHEAAKLAARRIRGWTDAM